MNTEDLRLNSDYLDENMAASMLKDCLEIKRILIASINTAKDHIENEQA